MAFCGRSGVPDDLKGSPNDDPRRQLVEVEEKIFQVEAQLSKHLEQRRSLKQQINTRFSPLIQLPLDILSEISMAAFPENDFEARSSDTPLLLGSICRTWRDVAWSMPRLWRTIRVDVKRPYRMSKASLLKEWLLRSRQLPLSLYLTLVAPASSSDPSLNVIQQIMDLVARCSERWQDVCFDMPYFFGKEFCLVPHEFSQLRKLSLLCSSFGLSKDFYIFQHAPILSEVFLQEYEVRDGAFLPAMPLLRLTVENTWIDECLLLLKRHPNLVHCAFKSIFYKSTTSATTVKASSLQSLEINFIHSDMQNISLLLDNLSTPNLHELAIHGTMADDTFPHTSLILLIQRSSCPLVRLDLCNVHISDEQLVECLTILPSLKELHLEKMAIGAHTIHEFTLGQGKGPLLPNLTSLSLVFRRHVLFDFADLVKMVRSRRQEMLQVVGWDLKAVARMESISVNVTTYGKSSQGLPTIDVLAQFQDLEDEGMVVHLEIGDH